MTTTQIAGKPLPVGAVLGVPIHVTTMEEALQAVESFVAERVPRLVVTLDSSGLVLAAEDAEWRELLRHADLVTPDSSGVVWALRRQGVAVPERVAGCDLVGELCRLSQIRGYRIFLLGGKEGVAEKAASNLTIRYPGCNIVGCYHGYFAQEQEENVLSKICEARPDILLVAMGMPRQEKWAWKHRDRHGVPVSIGVGGTLDVYAGVVKRAPRVMQTMGMEWMWRVARNPRKLRKVLALPAFVWMVYTNKNVV